MRKNIFYRRSASLLAMALMMMLSGQAGAQDNQFKNLPQFLFPEFSPCTVKLKSGKSQDMIMNYNMVSGRMVFERNGSLFDLQTPELVDTVIFGKKRFIRASAVYYEVLLKAPITLFLHHKGELLHAGKPAAYGGTSQVSATTTVGGVSSGAAYYNLKIPSEYIVKTEKIFMLRNAASEMNSFTTARQFLKLFPEKETELQQFIKEKKIKFDNNDHVVELVRFCNTLVSEQ